MIVWLLILMNLWSEFCILDFFFFNKLWLFPLTLQKTTPEETYNFSFSFCNTRCPRGSNTFQVEFKHEQISANKITEEPQQHNNPYQGSWLKHPCRRTFIMTFSVGLSITSLSLQQVSFFFEAVEWVIMVPRMNEQGVSPPARPNLCMIFLFFCHHFLPFIFFYPKLLHRCVKKFTIISGGEPRTSRFVASRLF